MLLSLAQWLQTLSPEFAFFRVFQYITFRAVMAAMTALLIGLTFGPWVIKRLTALKIGQPIRDYGVSTFSKWRASPPKARAASSHSAPAVHSDSMPRSRA